ncbi:hypothetical protein [Nocardia camponoti]|uniref:Uncharacterized protein n=1 Tax=Nocardia camponoti TaxID=1616106 RepID=A0A917VBL2_9NOCA|nr:hypothetical protein [Nocardia camponoti]GGK61762.1 hypothetical protein GCM10011591_37550 [Nocardia camponoti]
MTRPFRYVRDDWFGPASFIAATVGLLCIALPYTKVVPHGSGWLVATPLVAGAALLAMSGLSIAPRIRLRRTGIGLLAAFAAFILAIPCFLAGLALSTIFR